MTNVVCFIPARGQSKSIPKKNIKLLGGKPLVNYSIESAIKAGLEVIVNTDDQEIADVAMEAGARIMKRPISLAKDDTSMFDVLRSEIPKISFRSDMVILLQPTVPFRKVTHIKMAIELLKKNWAEYDSVITVERIPEKYHPMLAILQTSTGNQMIFGRMKNKLRQWFLGKKFEGPTLSGMPISQRVTRRQDHPTAYVPTGSVYLFKTSNLKKGSIYGEKVLLIETESEVNINELNDFNEAERLLNQASNDEKNSPFT